MVSAVSASSSSFKALRLRGAADMRYTSLSFQDFVIQILDTLYHDQDYPRFFVLETIARVLYFGIGGQRLVV